MAIYLDETENEHEVLIKAIDASSIAPWIKKSLIERIEYDLQTKKDRENCKHTFKEYSGEKKCCAKCGAFGKDMGFSWTMKSIAEKHKTG